MESCRVMALNIILFAAYVWASFVHLSLLANVLKILIVFQILFTKITEIIKMKVINCILS